MKYSKTYHKNIVKIINSVVNSGFDFELQTFEIWITIKVSAITKFFYIFFLLKILIYISLIFIWIPHVKRILHVQLYIIEIEPKQN